MRQWDKIIGECSHINHPCVQICHWRALMISLLPWLLQMIITLPKPIWHQISYFVLISLNFSQFSPLKHYLLCGTLTLGNLLAQMVSQHFICQTAEIITEPLTLIYNHSLNTGLFLNGNDQIFLLSIKVETLRILVIFVQSQHRMKVLEKMVAVI